MFSLFSRLFSKPKEDDYEAILSKLANDIQKRRVRLSEIRLRERRASLLVTLYTFSAWIAYVSMWYYRILPFRRDDLPASRFVLAIPVVLGPIVVLFIRRIVQLWYQRIREAEEKTLTALEKSRRDKLQELKKKTNFYSTRDLLQKYEEGPPASVSNPPTPQTGAPRKSMGVPPMTPQRQPFPGHLSATPANKGPVPMPPPDSATFPLQQPLAPPRKQWYDRLADAVLGADDANSDASKYALICEQCFKHNGLVKAEDWETTQYICPKCNHLNQGPKVKKQISVSPQSISEARPRRSGRTVPIEPGDVVLSPTQGDKGNDQDEMDVDGEASE